MYITQILYSFSGWSREAYQSFHFWI